MISHISKLVIISILIKLTIISKYIRFTKPGVRKAPPVKHMHFTLPNYNII